MASELYFYTAPPLFQIKGDKNDKLSSVRFILQRRGEEEEKEQRNEFIPPATI